MAEFAWCDRCGTRVEVVDRSTEARFDGPRHELEEFVKHLVCGHSSTTLGRRSPLSF